MNNSMCTELKPVYDKEIVSYYKQAFVLQKDKVKTLYSYGYKVATINDLQITIHMCESKGQERHIKEFLKQNNFEVGQRESRKKLLARYNA